ncbi:unnamed protein product [Parnassius apollo]|uniref:(apollo) hypothetical protein n=1 Tax=Parnassius apollo TaxID=110799 RepID=A0A8S3Y9L0_PARAO|nr:unnamed protein product [Parnassius apollo]
MASERGVTWHTPTPPPHLYHVPAPSPPDPLQAIKGAAGNSVFRHTATPPELYRHTPTPPDKHLLRHTPSPGDVKANATLASAELYPHLGPGRDKLVRAEELLAYARGGGGGVDLTVGGGRGANGSPAPALSVRDAPTINSLIARAAPHAPLAPHAPHAPHARPPVARVDALLERLAPAPAPASAPASALSSAPAPASPHSVIVHPRAAHTPSPPSSNEDSTDSCGAPPGAKRKRKPERTIRMPAVQPPNTEPQRAPTPTPEPIETPVLAARVSPQGARSSPQAARVSPKAARVSPQAARGSPVAARVSPRTARVSPHTARVSPHIQTLTPVENGDAHTHNGPVERPPTPTPTPTQPDQQHSRRKTRSGSAETIDDIAAMIASTDSREPSEPTPVPDIPETPVSVDKLKSVLASPEPETKSEPEKEPEAPPVEAAAAPRRRSARTSNSESTNVPVESPSEAKPAEPEAEASSAEPTAASFVEVENQLEKMFAGLEEEAPSNAAEPSEKPQTAKAKKRRKSAPTKGEKKVTKRAGRASTEETRRKTPRRKGVETTKKAKDANVKDAYDSGSNASSSRSRGPYIQIVGPCASPVSVAVVNAAAGEEAGGVAGGAGGAAGGEWRNGLRARGLHASTLGLRYDASTPDASWLCAFCERGPHAAALGDLFGPYAVDTDCDEYRALDEVSRRRFPVMSGGVEVWFHEECAVWAGGVVAAGARVWGLAAAVWGARAALCAACGRAGAAVACAARACRARVHAPCAPHAHWCLLHDDFRALCPRHAPTPSPSPAPAPAPNR